MIAMTGSLGNSFFRGLGGRVEELLNQRGQGLQGGGVQDGRARRVRIGRRPVRPVGRDAKGGLLSALQDQGLPTRDPPGFQ